MVDRDGMCMDDVSQVDMDYVVRKLTQITRASTLEYALRVGSLIVHHFYAGEVECWRQRGPKTTSFRRLANHPQLPMSAAALYRCVAVFELCDRWDVVTRWKRITASHLRVVLRLGPEDQKRLLAAANDGRWTVQQLEMEARGLKSVRAAGRRVKPPVVAYASALERATERVEQLEGPLELRNLSQADHQYVVRALERAVRRLAVIRDAIQEHSSCEREGQTRSARRVVGAASRPLLAASGR